MSSRYPPAHDSRYVPRARSRSPPRYQEWRPNGPPNSGFSNRHSDFNRGGPDPPRGPKTFGDAIRAPAPTSGPSAPLGPRGRGVPPRTEFRELRDAPPLGSDRSFREREFDRRPRPASPRPRSPVRNFRDGPPLARELDLGRGRRDSRDGLASTTSTYSDQGSSGPPLFNRGGFGGRGRGRGRGDFDFRDRSRRIGPPGHSDERNVFRPRDRSPYQRWGSISSRPEREEWRPERREEDRWPERDDRERDADRFRKDLLTGSRFDTRHINEGPTRTPTPHGPPGANLQPSERPLQTDQSRDDVATRRLSNSTLISTMKEPRREPLPPQADLLAGRAESSTAKYGSRTSSPPPSGPQVPAFGSFSTKPSVYAGPTSNVWKAPPDIRPTNAPFKAPIASSPVPKTAPTAPKAQLNAPPPAAPRAPRALESGHLTLNEPSGDRAPSAPKSWAAAAAPPSTIPTAPWALREDRNTSQFTQPPAKDSRSLSNSYHSTTIQNLPESPKSTLTSSKSVDGNAVSTGTVSSHIPPVEKDARSARTDAALPKSGSPPPSAPSGPRRTHSFSTSPTLHNPSVPTAPKAIRAPPVAPRAVTDRGLSLPNRPTERGSSASSRAPMNAPRAPAWNQWIRPGAQAYRESIVPSKRDASGEEKHIPSRPYASPAHTTARRTSEPFAARFEDGQVESGSDPRKLQGPKEVEVDTRLGLSTDTDQEKTEVKNEYAATHQNVAFTSRGNSEDAAEVSSEVSSDDEGMDLDEQDFAQSKAKFERQKAHLESQMIDLSERRYRATSPMEQIARLAAVSALDLVSLDVASPSVSEESIGDGDTGMKDFATVQPAVQNRKEEEREEEERGGGGEGRGEDEGDEENEENKREGVEEAPERLLTPKQEEVDDVIMHGSDPLDDVLQITKQSVETIDLPYLSRAPLTPLSERGVVQETIARQKSSRPMLLAYIEAQEDEKELAQSDLRRRYLEKYRQWCLDLQILDRSRADRERDERQISADPGPDPEASSTVTELSALESSRSRLHKFSSEYDIQKVLKESEETARIEQERLERESKKAQADLEKEASIPDIYDPVMRERRLYLNNNRYRAASCLTDIFGYEPPLDTFGQDEHKKFLELFKDRPKKWGEIASQLPGRTYADCIHHYYAFKWDGRFRETKRKPKSKGGRGRGGKAAPRTRGAALMADLSRTDEENPPVFTETGRPRRAATRTAYGDKDAEAKGTSNVSATSKKGAPANDTAVEKPAKRRKGATSDKPGRKGRQPQAAAPAASPTPQERDSLPNKEELARAQNFEDASLLTGLQAGRRAAQTTPLTIFAQENLSQGTTSDTGENARLGGQPALQKTSASSYWSVPEQTDMIKFLAHFGTDFAAISAHMGTKTQTMVMASVCI